MEEKSILNIVLFELQRVPLINTESGKYDTLTKCFKLLYSYKGKDFEMSQKGLVQEEIDKLKQKHDKEENRRFRKRNILIGELMRQALDLNIYNLAYNAGSIIINYDWSTEEDHLLMQVKQCEAYFWMGKAEIENLSEKGYSFAFQQEEDKKGDITNSHSSNIYNEDYSSSEVLKRKNQIITNFQKGAELAEKISQNWAVFHGAIILWNCFLPIFKNSLNDSKLLPSIKELLRVYFECMRNSIKDIEKQIVADYDLDSKIQVYGNLTLVYARLLENDNELQEVKVVTDSLLLAPLSAQTRRMVNSARARVLASLQDNSSSNKVIFASKNSALQKGKL
jgi:hypothetical protein